MATVIRRRNGKKILTLSLPLDYLASYDGSYDSGYAKIDRETNEVEIYGIVAYKGNNSHKLLDLMTSSDFYASLKTLEAKREEEKAKKDYLEMKNKDREEWIASLPDEIDGFKIDKVRGEVLDDIGNYLFMLPRTPVAKFREWLRDNYNEFLEYGE